MKTDKNLRYNTRAANIDLMKQSLSDVEWISALDSFDMNDASSQSFRILLTNVFLLTSPRRRKACIVTLKCLVWKGRRINFGRSTSCLVLLKT